MESHDKHRAELHEVERRLLEERPTVSALHLDSIKQDVYARVAREARPGTTRRLAFMRSRMAIITTMALGLVLSGSGVGLAVSGTSGDGTAAGVQYQPETTPTQSIVPPPPTQTTPTPPPEQPAPPVIQQAPNVSTAPTPPREEHRVPSEKPESEAGPAAPTPSAANVVQPVAQVAATAPSAQKSLPFTGYNAIPILVGGLLLLALGLVLRHQTRGERS